jgi:hypothetical protein
VNKYVNKRANVGAFGAALAGSVLALACSGEPMGAEDGVAPGGSSVLVDTDEPSEPAVKDGADLVLKSTFSAGCSAAQTSTINTAESVATIELAAIALDADDLVNNPSSVGLQQLQNFFAVTSVADRRFVMDTYANILNVVHDSDYVCLADGDVVVARSAEPDILCGDASGAIASTDRGTLIRLCPDFFASNNSIIQASVIIHELSHQNRTAPPPGVPTDDLNFVSIHTAPSYGNYANKCLALQCL